jgi:hypothetical protein
MSHAGQGRAGHPKFLIGTWSIEQSFRRATPSINSFSATLFSGSRSEGAD